MNATSRGPSAGGRNGRTGRDGRTGRTERNGRTGRRRRRAPSRRQWVVAALVAVGALAVSNVTRSAVIPSEWHFGFNLSLAVVALAFAWSIGLTRDDLGLRPSHVRAGVRLGGAVFVAVLLLSVVGGAIGAFVPSVADAMASGAGEEDTWQDLLWRVLVVIPIGTVVVEEIAFRGVLLGAMLRATTPVRAAIWSSLVFGLWHVYPAFRDAEGIGRTDVTGSASAAIEVATGWAVLGTFAATALAGLVFAWLRLRSRSTVAPMLAHLATNTLPLTAAWVVTQLTG